MVEIRRARPADREAIQELWLALIDHHRRLSGSDESAVDVRPAVRAQIARGLGDARCRLLVAPSPSSDAVPEGFVFAEVEPERAGGPGRAWIHELWVVPERRRCGLASLLLEAADAFFAERGAGAVHVRVESANVDGLRFWEHRRFTERARVLTRES